MVPQVRPATKEDLNVKLAYSAAPLFARRMPGKQNLGNTTTLPRERHVPEPFSLFKGKTLKDTVKWQWKLGGIGSSEFFLAQKRGGVPLLNRSRLSIWSLEIPSFGQNALRTSIWWMSAATIHR